MKLSVRSARIHIKPAGGDEGSLLFFWQMDKEFSSKILLLPPKHFLIPWRQKVMLQEGQRKHSRPTQHGKNALP